MLEHSQELKEIAAALAKAQGSMELAPKDSTNPFFGSDYSDLASCWNTCRKPLADNGLSVIQSSNFFEGRVYVTTMILHISGQYFKNTLPLDPVKKDPQGVGSAITYGRRYDMMSLIGIAPKDDDGNNASKPKETSPSRKAKQRNKNQTSNEYQSRLQDGIREAIIKECKGNECSEHWKISQESLLKEGYFKNPLAKELFKTLVKKWEDGLEKEPPEITEPLEGESNGIPKTENEGV